MTKKVFILTAFIFIFSMAFISGVSAEEKIVLLAMDDFQVWWLENIQDYIVQKHIDNNISVTLGVIPSGIEDPWGAGDRIIARIQAWDAVSTIDVAQHGYDHEVYFEGMNYSAQYNDISKGKNLMTDAGVTPVSFIPPFGSADDNTIKVLRDLGFHTFYDPIWVDITPTTNPLIIMDQLLLCIDEENGKNCVFKDYNTIKSQIDQKINQYGVALVLYHMQDFESNITNDTIDTSKADQVINYANQLKQDNYTLMTVEQYYQYKNNVCTPEPVSTTCGTAVCGDKINNCGESVICGTCSSGYSCQSGQCIADCIPTTEVCDGVDNDCDSLIDEDYVEKATNCGVGICSSTGLLQCILGKEVNSCTPGIPETEVCNNVDDDCNQQIDEGVLWLNKGQACTTGIGSCKKTGNYICDLVNSSGPTICSATPGTPTAEVCDGIDNDCDNEIDEDYVSTPTSCGVGACFTQGQLICVDGSTQDTCTQGTPTTEVCNNVDDDCNGLIDEGLIQPIENINGACSQNTMFCSAGNWYNNENNYLPIAEIWDGIDNDCDGNVDEINSTINNLNIFRENNTVQFKEENNILIEFEFNLTNNTINLSNLFIEKQSNNSNFAYLIIKGLDLTSQNQTKTVYLDKILNGTGLCIKDQDITSISEISEECKGENETWIACPGLNGQYSCNLRTNNTHYKITGLKHSGIKEQATFCGDGVCNGEESCSSCSNDCGGCSSSGSHNSGRGDEGGGSIKAANQNNMAIQTAQTTQEEDGQGEIETIGKQEGASAGITAAVIGTTKQKVIFAIIFVMVLGITAFLFYNFREKK